MKFSLIEKRGLIRAPNRSSRQCHRAVYSPKCGTGSGLVAWILSTVYQVESPVVRHGVRS
ncbi:hypothetical protein B0O80DRAFT_443960 [Mortierella sp. GBAus27b]|nr:hypothetical protein B0O80DRAFT_443960 [Mortierella sp. GBAus27b]